MIATPLHNDHRVLQLDVVGLENRRDRWDAITSDCFMNQSTWLLNAWKHFHNTGDCELHGMAVADRDGAVYQGFAPWFRQTCRGISWWKLVGSGRVCSDYVKMPCLPGTESEWGKTVAHWIETQSCSTTGHPVVIEVEGHAANCPQWRAFFESLTDRGWHLDQVDIEGAWRVDLPEDWSVYESQLHKSRRRKAKKGIKLLEQNKVRHQVLDSAEAIGANWSDFVRLHQMRREQLGQPGCFSDSRFARFLKSATLEFAARGMAWLSVVHHDDRPLAILLMFDSGETSFMYQSGIDTDRMHLEPGHLVNTATILEAIRRGQRQFDWLRGDEPYKQGWLARRIPLQRTRLFAPNLAGWGIASAVRLKRTLQTWRSRRGTLELGKGESDDAS